MWKEQSHKSYRPVTVATFRSNFNYFIIQPIFTIILIMVVKQVILMMPLVRLNYLVHELAPLGYHLVNVFLHALVTLLYHQVTVYQTLFLADIGINLVNKLTFPYKLRNLYHGIEGFSDLQSEGDLDSIRNSCDVFFNSRSTNCQHI